MIKKGLSFYTLVLVLLILALNIFTVIPHSVLSWDIFGYYLYLPFTFIYNDLGLKDHAVVEQILAKYHNTPTFYQALPMLNGNWVMKYPMGMALLYSPWFFTGHMISLLTGYDADGFSLPYQLSLLYGSFIYTGVGLFFFRKSLLKYFDEFITSILLIVLVFGTNFMLHTSIHGQGLMSHNYLFFVFSLILWFTIRWHETLQIKYSIGLGITIGLSALSRPTEILVLMIPLLWNMPGIQFKKRIQFLLKNWKSIGLMLLIIFIIGFFQLIYWKQMTGKFLFNSYGGNAGEGMEFLHPYLMEVLFSFRKGWLIYTPVMAFALAGFFTMYRSMKNLFPAIFLFFIVSFYVIASWSCWWYADCFSQRAVIPMYVMLAFPFGSLLTYVRGRSNKIFAGFLMLLGILLIFNIFQSWQFLNGMIHPTRMTKKAYAAVFLQKNKSVIKNDLLLIDRNANPTYLLQDSSKYTLKQLDFQDFEKNGHFIKNNPDTINLTKVFKLSEENCCFLKFEIPYELLTNKEYAIIRVEADVLVTGNVMTNPLLLGMNFEHNEYPYSERITSFDSTQLIAGQWNKVSMDYLTPEVRRPNDRFQTNFYLKGKADVYLDNIRITAYEPTY
ncbi:MAG: hypothetical protein HOO86_06860 [Bacteroidales bacterium]|nr:hypothetical protein [Bacteroidales bacterium]